MGAIAGIIFTLFYLGFIIFVVMAFWKTYTKAGQPGWACLIPIYNYLVLADIAKVSRNQVWKAMAAAFVGMIIYMYFMFSSMNGNGQPDPGNMAIGLLIYFAAMILAMIFMFPVFKGIALNFGQSAGFTWGLMFLNVIFFAILGFGSAQYQQSNYQDPNILDSNL